MADTYVMLTKTDKFNMREKPNKGEYPAWYLEDYPSAGWNWETFPKSTDFLRSFQITSSEFYRVFSKYDTIDSFSVFYTASCRESIVDHLANTLVKIRMFGNDFPFVYIYIETDTIMSPMHCKYVNYLFSIIRN